MKKILLVDNFDSFTYNLVQQIQSIKLHNLTVVRNDVKYTKELGDFDMLVVSPGPKTPNEAGISNILIKKFLTSKPILGVCLGMQCINEILGGKTIHSPLPIHGKTSILKHKGKNLFKGLPRQIEVARYHSLICSDVDNDLEVDAWTEDGIPMSFKHEKYPVYGLQFHPESFMTKHGNKMLKNFLI